MLLLLIELNRSCFFCKTLINSSTFNVSVVNKICVTKQIVGINYSPPGPLVTPDTWHSFWPLCDPLIFMLSFKVFCFHTQSVTHFSLFMCLTIIKRSQITSVSRWEWKGGWTRLEGRLPWLSKGSLTPMKLDPGVEGVERSATWTRCFLAFPTKHTIFPSTKTIIMLIQSGLHSTRLSRVAVLGVVVISNILHTMLYGSHYRIPALGK